MPEQLYRDAASFGWDLPTLERANKLRVICTSPDVMLDQIRQPDGLWERLIQEIGAKRAVVDSISLFEYLGDSAEVRRQVYMLRNALKKHGLTTLVTKEVLRHDPSIEIPFEEYVMDGVIRVEYTHWEVHTQRHLRNRTLEIVKLRGTAFHAGKHLFTYGQDGLHILLPLSLRYDHDRSRRTPRIPTGIAELDAVLEGGLPRGATTLLDTNSKANFSYLLAALLASRIRAGASVALIPSSVNSFADLEALLNRYDLSLVDLGKAGRGIFLDYYNRPVPKGLEPYVVQIAKLSPEEKQAEIDKGYKQVIETASQGQEWFVYFDLNSTVAENGEAHARQRLPQLTALMRRLGSNLLAACNFAEISPELGSFISRTASACLKNWVEDPYQYLQVTKTPWGFQSEPYMVEFLSDAPFFRLWGTLR